MLEHTDLKVSSWCISQIKRKCRLDVEHNYNLSKKEDAKVSAGEESGDYGDVETFSSDLICRHVALTLSL